jgi:hypothetical protein
MIIDEICQSIQQRKLLSLYYEGEYRRIEPHVYGESDAGKILIRAYQVEGFSKSGESYFWKLFDQDKITFINLLDERFPGPRKEYTHEDPAIVKVYCQL